MTSGQRWTPAAGSCALVAGSFLIVKAVAVLVTGWQPPLLLEVAPLFLSLTALCLGMAGTYVGLHGWRRHAVLIAGGVGLVAGVDSVVTEVVGEVRGVAIATGTLAPVLAVVLVGWPRAAEPAATAALRNAARTVVWSVPVAFGMIAVLDLVHERLIELGLLVLAIAWARLGRVALTDLRAP